MTLEASVLAQIRDHVGSQPDDDVIEAMYNRDDVGTVNLAALKILQRRLADFEANYAEFSVDGDAKWNASKNIDALKVRIADLEAQSGIGSSVLSAGRLVRVQGR